MKKLNFINGQTYVCTKSDKPWWTVGKEYKVVLDNLNEPALIDDDNDQWYQNELNTPSLYFKLKDGQQLEKTYTPVQVRDAITKAYLAYDNDSQRLAFLQGYFSK